MYQQPIKLSFMSAVEIRSEINSFLDQVDDSFLKVIHSMLGTYVQQKEDPILGYRVDTGQAVHASQAEDEFENILEEVRQGDYMTIEDLIKDKSASW